MLIVYLSMHRLEARLKRKESEFDTLQSQYSQIQIQAKEAEQLITRLKRKLLVVSKVGLYHLAVAFYCYCINSVKNASSHTHLSL